MTRDVRSMHGGRTRTHGNVLGIDVGWSSSRKSSAACRLSWSCHEISWEIRRFRATDTERECAIRQVATGHALSAVAIDGPLKPGFDEIGRYRSAERLLSRGELPKRIGKPGQSSSPNGRKLNEQANLSARLIKTLCCIEETVHSVRIDSQTIVEAFPTTFLGVMTECPEMLNCPKARSDRYFVHLAEGHHLDRFLADLLPGRKLVAGLSTLRNHDDRAALVCALTALCVAIGEFTAVGDNCDGWIILPPKRKFAEWAWKAVSQTVEQHDGELRVLSPKTPSRTAALEEDVFARTKWDADDGLA